MKIDKADDENPNSLVFGDATTIKGDVIGGSKFDIRFYALASLTEEGNIDWLNGNTERSEPYKFLSYYHTTDADIFFGREAISESLASKISTHKLVLINGQSGSGKTSLINAGIIPNLIKKGYFTMVFRDYGYPTEVIKKGLASLENLNLDLSDCHSLLECLQATRQQIQRPIVIFFDQFERFFLNLTSSQERQRFVQEFAECLKNINALEMNFFIAIRQDFYGNLGDFWDVPEFNTESYHHYLKTLGEEEALAAIEKPLTKIPDKIGYEDNFVEQTLLPDLIQSSETDNHQQINPTHLQIVCNSLFDIAKKLNASAIEAGKIVPIGQELYLKLNKVSGILQGYVTKILNDKAKFTFDERIIAKSVLQQMVASQGTRIFCSFDDLSKKVDYPSKQIKSIIKKLDDSRLLETKEEKSHTEYSITHEYLAKQVNKWYDPKEREIKRAQEMWARHLDNWSASSHKIAIPQNQYKYIKKFESHLQVNEEGRSLLKKSSIRYWGLKVGNIIGISFLVGLTAFSINGYRNATINQMRASIQASEANFNSKQNELESLVEAVKAAKTLRSNLLLKWFPPNRNRYLDSQIKKALYQGYEQTNERNRLEDHKSGVRNAQFSPNGQSIITASYDNTAKLWTLEGELIATLEGHNDDVYNAQFSPDGQSIVTASYDNTAKLWTLEGDLIATLEGHKSGVRNAQFSPNGQSIVTASEDNTAKLWTLEGDLIATLEGHINDVYNAQFSPNGKLIATASYDNTARVWTLEGELIATLEGHKSGVRNAQFSPNGKSIITASYDQTSKLWTIEGELIATLKGHKSSVIDAQFSPNGKSIVTVSYDNTARVWTLEGELIATLEGHNDDVYNAQFSPDGISIVTASYDNTVRVWTLEGGLIATLKGHKSSVSNAQFSPDGKSIVTASEDNTARVWILDGKLIATLKGHGDDVYNAQFSPDGKSIVTASEDNTVKVWTIDGELTTTLEGHKSGVRNARFSPNGKSIVTASEDNTARVWTFEGDLIATLEGHGDDVYNAQFSPDGKLIVTVSSDNTAKVWTFEGDLIATLKGHGDDVYNAQFSPDGKLIVTASPDQTSKLWTIEGELITTLEGHSDDVYNAQFSPDGQLIITSSEDDTTKIWTLKGELITTLEGHKSGVRNAQFSPDGQSIITASYDQTSKLWTIEGELIATLEDHHDYVFNVQFSPDGQSIITASVDNTAKLWSTSGELIATLEGHGDDVYNAQFSPDGQSIITASVDNTAKLWSISGELIAILGAQHDYVFNVQFSPNRQNLNIDYMLVQGCQEIRGYLKHNSNVEEADRTLCDGIATVEEKTELAK